MSLSENKTEECLTEEQFFSTVSLIASKHGCRIVDINMDRHIIEFKGPTENEMACSMELDNALHKYIAPREIELYIRR
ncbi:MAG: hypothetical protein JRD05_00620 [Deltaproteobacteria bacterium]|nr:hypothetical protein [Deltaproteobacteria bacterium]